MRLSCYRYDEPHCWKGKGMNPIFALLLALTIALLSWPVLLCKVLVIWGRFILQAITSQDPQKVGEDILAWLKEDLF